MALHLKTSFIATVFNEEKTIEKFLDSLFSQTELPDEIIIVDGGSSDQTLIKIKNEKVIHKSRKNYKGTFTILVKRGNRSVGRNEAIKKAAGKVILCSDAGNILDKRWIENITKPFKGEKVDVVAGYYKGKPKNIFQKCLIPYVLVMEDNVNPQNFLPATRSIAFKKSIWSEIGGFDQTLSHNEDYVFARKLEKANAKIIFAQDAVVYWIPRSTFEEAFIMFFRFAFGDAEAGILRSKVLLLFVRYVLSFYFLFLSVLYKSVIGFTIFLLCFIFYIIWSIRKNYKYVKQKQAIVIFPLLQVTADFAVLLGTSIGLICLLKNFPFLKYIKQNIILCLILAVYVFILIITLRWGIPNMNHPFPYNMDEWHQLQAVRATFKYGTPNIAGAANGTMFHFLLSGLYLVPFTLFHIINPVVLKINDLLMRERIFELLRINTILWGNFSIIILYKIIQLIYLPRKLAIFLFTFTPIWLSLSGYFKYDIALVFWILLAIFFFLRFAKEPTNRNFLLAAIPSSLAISVKVSAIPLFLIYVFSYFWFGRSWKKNLKYFFTGIAIFISCILLFGMPDTLFGKGNIYDYVYSNVIAGPKNTSNYQLDINPYVYLFTRHYWLVFGHAFMFLFVCSILFWIITFLKNGYKKFIKERKIVIFIFFSLFIFIVSLVPLQIQSAGNRTLVLLPFLVLVIAITLREIMVPKMRIWLKLAIILIFIVQSYESFAWVYMKLAQSPQEAASIWIEKNIPKNKTIGIENIPIYQNLPDIIQKEFYFEQYRIKQSNLFKYQIIDSKSKILPAIIVITNPEIEGKVFKKSAKKDLLTRIQKDGFKTIANFNENTTLYAIFGADKDLYLTSIVAAPLKISVYRNN